MAWKKTEAAVFNSAPSRVQLLHLSRSTELHQTWSCLWQIGSRWAPATEDESLLAAGVTSTRADSKAVAWGSWRNVEHLFMKNYCTLAHQWRGGRWSMTLSRRLPVCAEEPAPVGGDEMWKGGEVLEWAVGFIYTLASFTATVAPCTLTHRCKGALLDSSHLSMHQWLVPF